MVHRWADTVLLCAGAHCENYCRSKTVNQRPSQQNWGGGTEFGITWDLSRIPLDGPKRFNQSQVRDLIRVCIKGPFCPAKPTFNTELSSRHLSSQSTFTGRNCRFRKETALPTLLCSHHHIRKPNFIAAFKLTFILLCVPDLLSITINLQLFNCAALLSQRPSERKPVDW